MVKCETNTFPFLYLNKALHREYKCNSVKLNQNLDNRCHYGYQLKLKFAIFSGHSTNTNIYASIFPNIRQFMNEKEEGFIEELTRTYHCLNTKTAPLYIPLGE